MTTGIPRFQELINATRNPKIVNHIIHLNTKHENVKSVRERCQD